jgi:uncharacterized protein (TIGR03067 family)
VYSVLIAGALALAAPVPKELKKAGDETTVLGAWESVVADYSLKPGAAGAVFRFAAEGKGGVTPPPGMGNEISATYTIDPTANPKRFEWKLGGAGTASVATYELDGDTLKLAFGEAGKQPAAAAPAQGVSYYELKRVKADK